MPWGSATTLGTGTHWDAWGSSWPKPHCRAPQRLPPRRELHPLSTVPSRSQGLQRKELEPDQMQPENTNTYGEMPRAFPRKRLLWKRRWQGPADLAGRRQWDCGGRCCSTSSPRLPASLTQPRLCPLLHFCSQALHVCCLQTGLGGGGCPPGSWQQRVLPWHSPGLVGTTALGPVALGLAGDQRYGENTTGPSSPHQSRVIARTSSGALTPQISKFLAAEARPWVCTAGPPRPLWSETNAPLWW